jgi:hypothetical protein
MIVGAIVVLAGGGILWKNCCKKGVSESTSSTSTTPDAAVKTANKEEKEQLLRDIYFCLAPLFPEKQASLLENIAGKEYEKVEELCDFLDFVYPKCNTLVKRSWSNVMYEELIKGYQDKVKNIDEKYFEDECGEEARKVQFNITPEKPREIRVYAWAAFRKVTANLQKLSKL